MSRFTFHVLGLVHTSIAKSYNACAYSQKILKFVNAMTARGHECILYSNEGAEVDCETVQILTEDERASWFGSHEKQKLYDLRWDSNEPYWKLFNARCIDALKPRVGKGDFILTASGCVAQPVAEAFPGSYSGIQQTVAFVEPFVGYYGVFSRYWAAESHSHREWIMGRRDYKVTDNDTAVIPNYWDVREFSVPLRDFGDDPYYFFVGRIIPDKGWSIAVDVTKSIGARLILAGQGDPGKLPPHVEFIGHVDIATRNRLMAGSIATFCPTYFREPFGGTAAEAQLCGTPAITTDHGAFTETVRSRWRCASHAEFVGAAEAAKHLSKSERLLIKQRAVGLWGYDAVMPQFERFFQRIMDRWGEGWYARTPIDPATLR